MYYGIWSSWGFRTPFEMAAIPAAILILALKNLLKNQKMEI